MQLLRGILRATGMITQTATEGSCISRPALSVVQHRLLAVQFGRLYTTALQQQASCSRVHPSGSVLLQQLQFSRQHQHRQISVKATEIDAEPTTVYELDMSDEVNRDELSPDYRNYFSLVGNIASLDKEPRDDRPHLLVSLKVAREPYTAPGDHQLFDTFHIECWDKKAEEAAADPRLQDDQFVRVFGTLVTEPGSITMQARDFAIITNFSPEALVSNAPYNSAVAADYSQAPAAAAAAQQQYGAPRTMSIPGMPVEPSTAQEQQWMALFQNPSAWWDNRDRKRNPKAPDFVLKDKSAAPQGCPDALWVEDNKTPRWVKDNLQLLPGGKSYTPPSGGSSGGGGGGTAGDGGSLAVRVPAAPAGGTRPWFLAEEGAPLSDIEAAWADVFTNYQDWWDNRLNKMSERSPDFKHKKNGVALWQTSKQTPLWVHEHIAAHLPQPPPKRHQVTPPH